jgi:AcrR family transcriptional regulator
VPCPQTYRLPASTRTLDRPSPVHGRLCPVETVAAVLDAASELFGSAGFSGVSIDDVALACGRTKGAIYHHFATKEALFEEVFRLEQRRIADVVVAAATSTDPAMALAEALTAYIEEIATNPRAARITLLDAPTVMGFERWRRCDDGPFRAMLTDTLAVMARSGQLDSLDADLEALADAILGAVTENALVVATSPNPKALSEPRARACAALICGLLHPPDDRTT